MKPALSTTALSMPLVAAGLLLATAAWTPAGVDLGSRSQTRGSVRDNLTVSLFNHGAVPQVSPSIPWFMKASDPAAAEAAQVKNLNMFKSQLRFTENRGQAVDQFGSKRSDVLYYGGAAGTQLYFTKTGIGYVFAAEASEPWMDADGHRISIADRKEPKKLVMNMELLGSNPSVRVSAEDQAAGVCNYIKGPKENWILGVGSYHRLRYQEIYKNIDMIVNSQASGIKYDFVVRPGGDASQIRFRYAGAKQVSVNESGSLRVETAVGTIEEQAPYSYQGDEKQEVSNAFEVSKSGVVSFRTGSFDASKPLVIDPTVIWSTFFGDDNIDQFNDVRLSSDGTFVAAGYSSSSTIASADGYVGAPVAGSHGGEDGLVAKFNANFELLWYTFVGGSGSDIINSVAVDNGAVYVMGSTNSTNLPTAVGACGVPQTTRTSAALEQFVACLNSSGVLKWASYKGGSLIDEGLRIAVRTVSGVRIIAGTGSSAGSYPTGGGGIPQLLYPGGNTSATVFRWAECVGNDGATEQWSTYIGGGAIDVGTAIEIDAAGNILIGGYTESKSGAVAGGGFPANNGGNAGVVTLHSAQIFSTGNQTDGYLGKLNGATGAIQCLGYHGGTGNDEIVDSGLDNDNSNIYVVGRTVSDNLPLGNLAASLGQHSRASGTAADAYMAKFGDNCVLDCATYHGGTASDLGIDCDVLEHSTARHGQTTILICGLTQSTDMPVSPGSNQQGSIALPLSPGGGSHSVSGSLQDDFFMVCYSEQCGRLWSTYWGGTNADQPYGISAIVYRKPSGVTVDRIVVAGVTYSGNYPTQTGPIGTSFFQSAIFPAGEPDGALLSFEFQADEKLAIELSSFGASAEGRQVVLGWKTASEDHNAGFEVQRAELSSKYDKTVFKPIASYFTRNELIGLGSSPVGKEYRFTDDDPSLKTDKVYIYRLVDIASDGIRTDHPAVSIRLEAANTTPVYDFAVDPISPNPTNGELVKLNFTLREADAVTVEVYSTDGRKVATPIDNRSFTAGDHAQGFSVATLAPGVYTAVVSTGNFARVRTRQFVVVR